MKRRRTRSPRRTSSWKGASGGRPLIRCSGWSTSSASSPPVQRQVGHEDSGRRPPAAHRAEGLGGRRASPRHAVHRHPRDPQRLKLRLRGPVDAVEPVVDDQDGLAMVVQRLVGGLDDERRVEAAVELHPRVRVEEEGPGVRGRELVEVAVTRSDGVLGEAGHAVGIVLAQADAVPVDGRRLFEVIVHADAHRTALAQAHLGTGQAAVVGARGHPPGADLHLRGPGTQHQVSAAAGSELAVARPSAQPPTARPAAPAPPATRNRRRLRRPSCWESYIPTNCRGGRTSADAEGGSTSRPPPATRSAEGVS